MPFVPIALFGANKAPTSEPVSAPKGLGSIDGVRGVSNRGHFTVHKSTYSNFKQLTGVEFLKKYRGKVILCVSPDDAQGHAGSLKSLAGKHNARICYLEPREGAGKKEHFQSASQEAVLTKFAVRNETIHGLNEKHTILIDPDSFVRDDMGAVCERMERSGFDIATVEVLPGEGQSKVGKRLQGSIVIRASLLNSWLADNKTSRKRSKNKKSKRK